MRLIIQLVCFAFYFRNGAIGFIVVVFLNVWDSSDGKVFEEFKKDYASINEACKSVGYIKKPCNQQGSWFCLSNTYFKYI